MRTVLTMHRTSPRGSWERVKVKQERNDRVLEARSLRVQSRFLNSLKMLPAQTTTQSPVPSDEQKAKTRRSNR